MERMDKALLRTQVRSLYADADMYTYVQSSLALIESQDVFTSAMYVLGYVPIMQLEIPFMNELQKRYPKKKWYMPEVVGEGEMVFVRVPSSSTSFEDTGMYRVVKNTCVIVPALALDMQGNRLGKGGGYYDRFLAAHPSLIEKTLAVVPDFARVSGMAMEAHDIRVQYPLFATQVDCK